MPLFFFFVFDVAGDLPDLQAPTQSCFIKNRTNGYKVEIDSNNNRNNISNKVIIIKMRMVMIIIIKIIIISKLIIMINVFRYALNILELYLGTPEFY